MRLFLAIDPDETARAAIVLARDRVRRAAGDLASALTWTAPANLHITLHFLGEIDAARVPELERLVLAPVDQAAFDITTRRLGTFPERGAPRVLWLGVTNGAAEIKRIHATIRDRLVQVAIPTDDRPFTPHFTLARTRPRDRRGIAGLAHRLTGVGDVEVAWRARRVTLWRSHLGSGPPRYEALAHLPLE